MKEGVYKPEELSNEAYHADPALGSSGLKLFADCPYKYKYGYLDGNRKETKSLNTGKLAHEYILENESFQYSEIERKPSQTSEEIIQQLREKDDQVSLEFILKNDKFKYVIYDELRRGSAYKEAVDAAAGSYLLKSKELEALEKLKGNYDFLREAEKRNAYYINKSGITQLEEMRAEILEHDYAKALLSDGLTEMSFFAKHPEYGVMMKARPDYLVNLDGNCIVDYKTTCANLQSRTQSNEAFKWERHVQAAFHKYVVEKATGGKINRVVYVTQESEAPYLVRVFEMPPETIEVGLEEIEARLSKYQKCLEKQEWPKYPKTIELYQEPGWFAHRRLEF